MTPRTGHDRVRVERVSAGRLLAHLGDQTIDVLITDPPYTTVNRRAGSGHLRAWFKDGLSWPEIRRVLAVARRKLKPTGLAFVMTNGDGLASALAALQAAGFVGIRTITWDRRWPGLGGGLRHRTEFILLGRLPASRPVSGSDLVAVSAVGPGTANRYPTEKPVGLGRATARIAGIGPRDTVVDPFCGSGALLVGSAERGAAVVGGDVAAQAVRLARARLAKLGSTRMAKSAGDPDRPVQKPATTRLSRVPTRATTAPSRLPASGSRRTGSHRPVSKPVQAQAARTDAGRRRRKHR
jgi:hypothetical protein